MKKTSNELIFDVHLEDFESQVIEASHTTPVLVDFWAEWCAPCHALAPHITKVVNDLEGKVRLAKLEVDEGENMKLAGKYRVRGFPTVMLFHGGKEVAHFASARPTHWIEQWLDEHLGELID